MDELINEKAQSVKLINEMTQNSEISPFTEEIPVLNPEGEQLPFSPMNNCLNKSAYDVTDSMLKRRNISATEKKGLMVPCAASLPTNGRYFYKIKAKNVQHPFNISLGILGEPNIQNITCVEGVNTNAIFYSSNSGMEVIY